MLPLILSLVGGTLPMLASALAGAKSEDEARGILRTQMDAARSEALGRGADPATVDEHINEAFKGAIEDEMSKGAIPGWAEMALGLLGGGIGAGVGKMIAKKGASAAAKTIGSGASKMAKGGADEVSAIAGNAESAAAKPAPNMNEAVKPFPTSDDVNLDEVDALLSAKAYKTAPNIPAFSRAKPPPPSMMDEAVMPFPRRQPKWEDVESEAGRISAAKDKQIADMMAMRGDHF